MRLYYRFIQARLQWLTTPYNKMLCILHGVKFGSNFHTRGLLKIRNYSGEGGIFIGNNVNINSCINADPIGCDNMTIFHTNHGGKIRIGNNVGMSNIAITAFDSVEIGDYSTIGAGVRIYDTDFHPIDALARQTGNHGVQSKPVSIGKHTFIGAKAIILKGVSIGDYSIVGAGAVVTKSIPSNQIWAGNPAEFIKVISDDKESVKE